MHQATIEKIEKSTLKKLGWGVLKNVFRIESRKLLRTGSVEESQATRHKSQLNR
jgi:hypothetical protein